MKQNVIIIRKMGNFDVSQRTKDGMFNATSLLRQWNKSKGLKRGKEVNDFLKIDKTKEFIFALEEDYNDNTKKIVLTKRGLDGGTWLDPLLFREVAIAMQWIVYNKKGKNLRQSATQEELKELNDLQGKLSFLIDNNYITSYNQLLSDMRIMYNKKYRKF